MLLTLRRHDALGILRTILEKVCSEPLNLHQQHRARLRSLLFTETTEQNEKGPVSLRWVNDCVD